METQIEYGSHKDINDMELLYNDLHDALEKGINYPGWIKDIYPTREDAVAGIDNHSLFVARSDNGIIGSMILNHTPEKGYSGVKWQCEEDYNFILVVHTFVVHPAYSKLGIGMQLMNFAEDFGRRNNMKAIRLDVYEKNEPAIRLYERCNYQYIQKVDLGLACHGLDWFKLYEKLL